jgi:hypothetical protein
MTDQPRRVTPAEISALLSTARQLGPSAPLEERIAFHERKANLLSRIAEDLGTAEAHEAAADAWHQLSGLCRRAGATAGTEAGQ